MNPYTSDRPFMMFKRGTWMSVPHQQQEESDTHTL